MRIILTILFISSSKLSAQYIAVASSRKPVVEALGQYFRNVTIDNSNTGTALNNTQFSLSLTSSNFDFNLSNSNGSDIRIFDSATQLPLYISSYDSAANLATIWFKASIAKGQIKVFKLYYNSPGATSVSSYDAIFEKRSSATIGLWHLDEGTGATVTDASGNGNNGTIAGNTWVSDLKFSTGSASLLNGTSGVILLPVLDTWPQVGTLAFTYSPTVSPVGLGYVERIMQKVNVLNGSPQNYFDNYISNTTGAITWNIVKAGVQVAKTGGAYTWTAGNVYRIVYTWDNAYFSCFINGSLYYKFLTYLPNTGSENNLALGASYYNGAGSLWNKGKFDEIVLLSSELTPGMALADAQNRKLIPAIQQDKFQPDTANIMLLPGASGTWDDQAVGEPSLMEYGGQIKMAYIGAPASLVEGVGITSSSGMSFTNAPTSFSALRLGRPLLLKDGSTYYLYTTNLSDGHLYAYTTTDFSSWTSVGKVLDKSVISSTTLANASILRNKVGEAVQIGGKYIMYIDALFSGIWEVAKLESTSLTSGWTYIQKITSLQFVANETYGSGDAKYFDGTYHIWTHLAGDTLGGATSGVLPTRLAYAKSTDGINFTDLQITTDITQRPFFPKPDQNADSEVFEYGGKVYLLYSVVQNTPTIYGEMRVKIFDGSLSQLVAGGIQTTIGARQ